MYFVCAEALTNVIKHASATKVDIEVSRQDDLVRTSITDDGTGRADVLSGTGLRGLADRVEALGGTLTVSSGRGDGTTVVATVPAG